MIIETCPKCGKDLFKTIICTYPPIPKWECECGWSYEGEPGEALITINQVRTIESRPKGKWAKTITYYPYCSNCEWLPEEDEMTHGLYNFCPNCGADMRCEE